VKKEWYSLLTWEHQEHQLLSKETLFLECLKKGVSGTLEIKGEGYIQFQVIMDDGKGRRSPLKPTESQR